MKELFSRKRAGNVLEHNNWKSGFWYIYKENEQYFLNRVEHYEIHKIKRPYKRIEIGHFRNKRAVYEAVERLINER